MTKPTLPLADRKAWKALESHYQKIRELHLRKLFADDPKRGERLTVEAFGIYLDYSKNRITSDPPGLFFCRVKQIKTPGGVREQHRSAFRLTGN